MKLTSALLVLHVAVLGFWLGAELVINSTFRFVATGRDIPLKSRSRLLRHVMNADQLVRYALAMQVILGSLLAMRAGMVPGSTGLQSVVAVGGAVWLVYIELVHRLRDRRCGPYLAAVDRWLRYVLLAVLAFIAAGFVGSAWPVPGWLRLKLGLFAGVVACGVGIRLLLLNFFATWRQLAPDEDNAAAEAGIRSGYRRSTAVLVVLWALIAAIVTLSVIRPALAG